MKPFVLHGDFLWSRSARELELRPDAWAVCDETGRCAGVFDSLPEDCAGLPVKDFAGKLIVPGYSDLHLHAPQFENIGLGMDLELLPWLEGLTFPEEERFASEDYARGVYRRFAEQLRRGFTTRAAVFATVHTPATVLLMELLEATGLRTMVGRVSMDRHCPNGLREENAETALAETELWLESIAGRFKNTAPILTPRFVPSCSMELMEGLGALAAVYGLPIQSHLDENREEIRWVRKLHPEYESYAAVYDGAGLLTPATLMAHCVTMTDAECDLMRQRGSWVVHCPLSNTGVRSGIAPVRKYLDRGLNVGLGSDISGGSSLDMTDVLRHSMEVSKLLWCLRGEGPHLRAEEAFYLAGRGGAAFFGRAGAFEEGYDFDAVVVDDSGWARPGESMERRFEKMIHCAHAGDVKSKYVAGRRIF